MLAKIKDKLVKWYNTPGVRLRLLHLAMPSFGSKDYLVLQTKKHRFAKWHNTGIKYEYSDILRNYIASTNEAVVQY